jgi:hypothetical protein
MGYTITSKGPSTYYPSDTVLADEASEEVVAVDNYTKFKEFQLIELIGETSKFRFKFDLKQGAAGANPVYGKIYRNDVAAGVEHVTDATANWNSFSEDINISSWILGEKIALYCKRSAMFGYVRKFQICGVGSEWKVI